MEFHMRLRCLSLMCFVALTSVSVTRADDLFSVNAVGSTSTVSSGASSLIGLVTNLTNNTNQFSSLSGQTFNANLTYAGIKNAITIEQGTDASGNKTISFQVPSTGLSKTFDAANGSLSDQLRAYLKSTGLADLAAFQASVNQSSFAGIVDGNPLAMTALLQDAGYQEFALHETPFDLDGKRNTDDGNGHFQSRFWVNGGDVDAGGTSGAYVDLTFAMELHFNDIIALTYTMPFRYQTLHSADIFMGGSILGLPITIIPARGGPITWTVTPAVQGGIGGSQDFVSGGIIYGAQIDSSLSYNLKGFTLTLADNIGYDHGADIEIAGYDFNTEVNQWIFKNGLQLSKAFGNFFIDASGTWTDFLHTAYVPGYFTPEVGVGFRFGRGNSCGLRVGFVGNYGEHYNTTGGNVLLYFSN
jgi:hypothetical protein